MYSEALLDHFRNPRNVGHLAPPAVAVEVTNPACGDILRLSAAWDGSAITQVAFQARGCTASVAAGSALTELMEGRSPDELATLGPPDVENALGGVPPESRHAAVLAIDALRALLRRLG